MTAVASGPGLWEKVKADLRTVIPEELFKVWFDNLVLVQVTPEAVVLGAHNDFCQIWITDNYLDMLEQRFAKAAGRKLQVTVRVSEEAAAQREKAALEERRAAAGGERPAESRVNGRRHRADGTSPFAVSLNPKNTFENFIVGAHNEMAHAAALAVAKSPGTAYNPLFVYGETGLGKTHLMHAVGHYVLRNRPDQKVAYLSCEKFTNEFINAIHDASLPKFRQRYRSVDVLLIDDVQFLAGKERVQEEFFHTFNDLFESGKQIILTSDRPVAEIAKLEKRLLTRFQWGMMADIRTPDLETRIAILRAKASALNASLPANVAAFIAERISSNVRQLEGALIKVASYTNLTQKPVDVPTAENLLRDILMEEASRQVTMETIQRRVSEHFGLGLADMVSRRRPNNIAVPRQLAMYLSRELTRHSLQEIGEAFGGRDHGTVIHACKSICNQMDHDGQFRSTVEYLRKKLAG